MDWFSKKEKTSTASEPPPSLEEALNNFVKISEQDLRLDAIAAGAEESSKFISFWSQFKSENPVVIVVVDSIQKQGSAYYSAIEESIGTAEAGVAFSADAIDLCENLLNPRWNRQELVQYASEMRSTASKAVAAATEARDLFGGVRTGLYEIVKDIEEANAVPQASKASREPSLEVSRPNHIDATTINKAIDGLMKLAKNVDGFANWWVNMETTLQIIESQAKSGSNTFRVRNTKRRWEDVSREYMDYKIKISRVRDRFPVTACRHES